MDRKVIELVKSALKKMTNRERKLFLRLLSEELAKELVRRRRLRKQEKEDPATKIINILEDLNFEWDDLFELVDGCFKEKCPVEEHLYEEHPYNIDVNEMNFGHKLNQTSRWSTDLTPEELRTFLEDEGQRNKVGKFLENLMDSKLREAVDEAKSRLKEIEKLVDEEMEIEEIGDEIRSHLSDVSDHLDGIIERGPDNYDVDVLFGKLINFLTEVYNQMVGQAE